MWLRSVILGVERHLRASGSFVLAMLQLTTLVVSCSQEQIGELKPEGNPTHGEVFPMWCRIVDSDTGRPVADARVELLLGPSESTASTPTDGEGYALFDEIVSPYKPSFLRVLADGYSMALCPTRPGHEARNTARTVHVRPEALVRVRLAGKKEQVASLQLDCDMGSLWVRDHKDLFTFGYEHRWIGSPSPDGSFLFRNVPADIPLRVLACDALGRTIAAADDLVACRNDGLETTLGIDFFHRLTGVAFDETDSPVQGLTLWLIPSSRCQGQSPNPIRRSDSKTALVSETKADGSFTYDSVSPGTWLIAPPPGQEFFCETRVITLTDVAPMNISLHLKDAYEFIGAIQSPSGKTEPGIVDVFMEDPHGASRLRIAAPDGTFNFYSPVPQPQIRAWNNSRTMVSALHTASGREAEITAHVAPIAYIEGDAFGGSAIDGFATLFERGRGARHEERVPLEGQWFRAAVPEGRYDGVLKARGNRVGVVSDVDAVGGMTTEVSCELLEGAVLSISLGSLYREARYTYHSAGSIVARGTIRSGESKEHLVPLGQTVITLDLPDGSLQKTHTVLRGGGSVAFE